MKKQVVFSVTAILCLYQSVMAQRFDTGAHDHVFTRSGGSKITLATGIPYIGVAEYAHGLSDRVTGGVLFGLTPNVTGYGIRVRAIVYQTTESFRVYFCTPVLYYPKTKELGGDPWWLTRPNINFEWIAQSGFRYKVGGSIIAAASHHSLFGNSGAAKFSPGLWNAIHAGSSFSVGGGVMFQNEISIVMNGLRVAGSDWVGGPPIILVIGLSKEI
ncbi:MAG: hypothetical protein ACYC09_00905 [Bacteroidota bacterium]